MMVLKEGYAASEVKLLSGFLPEKWLSYIGSFLGNDLKNGEMASTFDTTKHWLRGELSQTDIAVGIQK